MKKTISVLAILVLIALGYYFYQKSQNVAPVEKPQKEVIKIGVLGPLTGAGARYGEAMKWGIELAIEDINNNEKFHFKTLYQDTKFSPKDAVLGFKYLTDVEKVNVILGPAASGISKTIAPFSNKSKVVTLSSISTADTLKYAGDYYFRNVSPNSNQAETIADYIIKETKFNKVAVLYENNEYGLNMKTVFNSYFTSIGGDIIYENSYEFGQKDFKNLIVKVKREKPDVIFIPGTTWGIAILTKQLREYGIDALIMTGDGGYGEDIKKIAGKNANGLICTLMSVKDTTSLKYKQFYKKFKFKYKKEPDVYSIYSYDAMFLILNSIKTIEKPFNGEKIKNALYKIKYKGISGDYEFDKYGEVNKPFGLFEYKNGNYKRIN